MMEYARAEKQREHQPLFLTLHKSVQFSAVRKKADALFMSRMSAALAGRRDKYRNKIATERLNFHLFCTFVIRKII